MRKIRCDIGYTPEGEIVAYPFSVVETEKGELEVVPTKIKSVTGMIFTVKRIVGIPYREIEKDLTERSNVPMMLEMAKERAKKKVEI